MAAFSDSDDDDTFIKLGTPLQEIEEDEFRKKPVSLQDIQAKDSKGRPRFHGAFTGGFSAGYFNTVGSKQGWTPSTFVSSRAKKAEGDAPQRPEDFMDEEDFSEHGIAPRKLVTAGRFTSEERKRRRMDEATSVTQDATLPGVPALLDLIVPEKISIGVKLLRKMGWKEGQGLGPRLSKQQRKLQKSGKKIYGCALPPSSSSDEDDIDDSAVLKDVTFAPRDITPIHLLAKDNKHGLGYSGLDPRSALPSTHINLFEPPAITKTGRKGIRGQDDIDDSAVLKDVTFAPRDITPIHLLAKDNKHGLGYSGLDPRSALPSTHINLFEPPAITKTGRKGIMGQAFGVGALEDDDEDIYSTDHMSNYDITMADEEDNNFGWTAPGNKGQTQTPVGYVGKMLEGFKLSSTPLIQKKHFSPPTLPRNFRPVHVFRKPEEENQSSPWFPDAARERSQFRKPDETENQSGQAHSGSSRGKPQYTDAMSRGLALGEQPFVGSVFDLIPKEDKRRMEEAKQTRLGTKINETAEAPALKESVSAYSQSSTVNQEILQPVQTKTAQEPVQLKSSQQPVQMPTVQKPVQSDENQVPVWTQSSEASVDEQRRSNVPLFQGGAGFKPFAKDPDKQARYEKYLSLVKQGQRDPYSLVIMPGQTEWEMEREREEFARAAKLYKPLAGMMAMRFTTGKQQDDDSQIDVKVEETIDKCDATKAAEMKMFGKLTRDVLEWHPDRLVCKRFNIPDPYPGSSIVGLTTVKRDKFSVFNFLSFTGQPETSQEQLLPLPESSSETVSKTEGEKTESKVEKELNKSKNMKSIFSHLVDTQKETEKKTKGLSFSVKSVNTKKPKVFTSIFSHLDDSDDKPKRKLVPIETEDSQAGTGDRLESTNQEKESDAMESQPSKPEQKPAKEEKEGMDLFRAIFKNTDSEASTSSEEEEEEENKDSAVADHKDSTAPTSTAVSLQPMNLPDSIEPSPGVSVNPEGSAEPVSSMDLGLSANLPGNGEPIQSLDQRLSPSVDESEDEYGPALPPGSPSAFPSIQKDTTYQSGKSGEAFVDVLQSSKSSKKHRQKHHKHRSKKDKKEKHKKSKHKKKEKKKQKKKKERREKSSSETDNSSDIDTDSEGSSADVPSDKDILTKMKSLLPGQRLRAADFM